MKKVISVLVFVIGIIITTLFVGIMLSIEKLPFIGGSPEGWLGYWGGLIGAALGTIGAYLVMRYQLKEEKEERKSEKNPILVIGAKKYTFPCIKNEYELVANNIELSNESTIFDLRVPLINGGISPVFNLRIAYEIVDHNNMLKNYETFSEKKTGLELKKGRKQTVKNKILFSSCYGGTWMNTFSRGDSISVIMPGDTVELELPDAYRKLIQYLYINVIPSCTTSYQKPILKIRIFFENYELKEQEKNFFIVVGREKFSMSEYISGEFTLVNLNKEDEYKLK